jgi:K+-transporting ATPase ATPase C chain
MKTIMKILTIALRITAVTLVLTGIVYPLVVTGLAQLIFPAG